MIRRPKAGRIFYGWYMVGAAWAINILVAGTYVLGMGVLFNPIRTEMQWTAATISLAFSLRQFEVGVLSPVAGVLIDRLGPRRLMLIGLFMLGLGFLLLAQVHSLWQFYLAFLFLSIGPSIGYGQAMTAALVNWFRRHRVRALGLMWTGGSLGGIVVLLVALLEKSVEWRTTAIICGIAIWVWCLPLASLMRHRPEQYGWAPDGAHGATGVGIPFPSGSGGAAASPIAVPPPSTDWTVKGALRTGTFWILALAQAAFGITTATIVTVHLVPFLESLDISREKAASMVTILMLFTLPTRLWLSWVGDRFDKRHLLAFLFSLSAAGILILSLSHTYWQAIPFAVMAGLAHGGVLILMAALISDCFGTARFATISGLIHTISILGSIVGPFAAGLVFDATNSYRPAFLTVAVLVAAAAPLILSAKRPINPRVQRQQPPGADEGALQSRGLG